VLKALVFGANGQLGSELVRMLGPESAVTHSQASITDIDAVDALIADRRPDWVFNCAAYNAVDRAEKEPELAQSVNSHGPWNLARACARHQARLLHFSTNFVFDGVLDRPYVESDEPSPQGAYARSKLDGEQKVMQALPEALILRTAGVFGGTAGQSFPEKILQQALQNRPLKVVSDQELNPTYTGDLALAALELAEKEWRGIVHAVAEGCCAWDEFARAVLEEFALPPHVESITSEDLAAPARRPRNGCLVSERFRPLRHWRAGLRDWVQRVPKI
jgi:dTDP-4-dehydrorhamnose reductase